MKNIESNAASQRNGTINLVKEKNWSSTAAKRGFAAESAVEQIWTKFSKPVGHFIRARITDPATSEDILQDVFLKLQRRINAFEDPAKIEGWLFLVARNAVIDHYRTKKPTSELPESIPVELSATEAIQIGELHAKLWQIIERLPEVYREAFVLTTFEGYSQEDLARHLGISLSGAKSRVQRAREQLKEMLFDFYRSEFSRTPGCQPCPRGLFPVAKVIKATKTRRAEHHSKKSKQSIKSKAKLHV